MSLGAFLGVVFVFIISPYYDVEYNALLGIKTWIFGLGSSVAFCFAFDTQNLNPLLICGHKNLYRLVIDRKWLHSDASEKKRTLYPRGDRVSFLAFNLRKLGIVAFLFLFAKSAQRHGVLVH